MKILVEYTAVLSAKGIASGSFVEVPDETDVAQLLSLLGVKDEHHKYVVAFVNGEKKRLAQKLRDGDKVMLSVPVGGG